MDNTSEYPNLFANLNSDAKQKIVSDLYQARTKFMKDRCEFYKTIINSCLDNLCAKEINNTKDVFIDLSFLSESEQESLELLDESNFAEQTQLPIRLKKGKYVVLNPEFKKYENLDNIELRRLVEALYSRITQLTEENSKLKKDMLYKDERVAIADDIIKKKDQEEFETSDKFKTYRDSGVTYEEYRAHSLDGRGEYKEWLKHLGRREKLIKEIEGLKEKKNTYAPDKNELNEQIEEKEKELEDLIKKDSE